MSERIRSRAVMLPASCARKSSATADGFRELLKYTSSISLRISLPSTIFMGGSRMPSSKASGADAGVVGEEHVAVADAGVVAAVLERPLDLRVGDAGHVLHVRAEINELRVFRQDRGIEVERVHRHRRARQPLDRSAVLLVHVPQRMPHDFEGDRVEVFSRLLMQFQLGRNTQARRRDVTASASVENNTGELAQFFEGRIHLKVISKLPRASSRSVVPGCTTTVVSAVSTIAGPLISFPLTNFSPSKTGVARCFFRSGQ